MIYVDELFTWNGDYRGPDAEQARRVGARNGDQWCHMFADAADCAELHAFALRVGMRREWFQGDHYDLTPAKRARAVRFGAKEVSRREAVEIWRKQRRGNPQRSLF